jgi:abortive infection bacteriophage resistance protein
LQVMRLIGEFSFFCRKFGGRGLRYPKRALTYEEQVGLLESRGLLIQDKSLAVRWLSRTNYYRFSAYLFPFRNPDDTYKPGTNFASICEYYNFDRKLRLIVMHAIEILEIWLRTALTYEMAHQVGAFGYTKRRTFARTFNHRKFMGQLRDEVERSKEEFVHHYRAKYTGEQYLPIWMATELLTFGTLSLLYSALPLEIRKKVANSIGFDHSIVGGWLHSFGYIRNICAHHSRLWNRTLAIRPRCPKKWSYGKLRNEKIYLSFVILQHIIRTVAPEIDWRSRIFELLDAHPTIDLSAMGFPADWRQRAPWVP